MKEDLVLEDLIKKVYDKREGEYLWPKDLVELSIVSSVATLSQLKKRKNGPEYFQLAPHMCRYAKKDVADWLRRGRNK